MIENNLNLDFVKNASLNTLNRAMVKEIIIKNTICAFINETIGTPFADSSDQDIEFVSNNKNYTVTNIVCDRNGSIMSFTSMLDASGRSLSVTEMQDAIGLTLYGKFLIQNNVQNFYDKLRISLTSEPVDWALEIKEALKSQNLAKLWCSIEQNNATFERYYHPIPSTQVGDPRFAGYFSKYHFADENVPGTGSIGLFSCEIPGDVKSLHSSLSYKKSYLSDFVIHPQNINSLDTSKLKPSANTYRFFPGASIRSGFVTCNKEVLSNTSNLLKLDYLPVVTSIARNIPWAEHKHAIQITNVLADTINKNEMPMLGIVPDLAAYYSESIGLSMRIRGSVSDIYPHVTKDSIVFPSFGFYYYHQAVQSPLIKVLVDNSTLSPLKFLADNVLKPILWTYFDLAIGKGLIHEMHGQNVLIEYNTKTHKTERVILRDLESTMIAESKAELYTSFLDTSQETEDRSWMEFYCPKDREKYQISQWLHHWVMRVHIEPILGAIHTYFNIDASSIVSLVQDSILDWFKLNNYKYKEYQALIETDKYYVTNYFHYLSKMLDREKLPLNTIRDGIYFMPDASIAKQTLESL